MTVTTKVPYFKCPEGDFFRFFDSENKSSVLQMSWGRFFQIFWQWQQKFRTSNVLRMIFPDFLNFYLIINYITIHTGSWIKLMQKFSAKPFPYRLFWTMTFNGGIRFSINVAAKIEGWHANMGSFPTFCNFCLFTTPYSTHYVGCILVLEQICLKQMVTLEWCLTGHQYLRWKLSSPLLVRPLCS